MTEEIEIPKKANEFLSTRLDRLWYFAQIERGVEMADIDRDSRIGSSKMVSEIAKECRYTERC